MSTRRTVHFITPKEARLHYGEIIPAYQKAFAGDPWFEVSKCAGCESGFSAQSPGTVCESCGHKTGEEAYTTEELVDLLITLARLTRQVGILSEICLVV